MGSFTEVRSLSSLTENFLFVLSPMSFIIKPWTSMTYLQKVIYVYAKGLEDDIILLKSRQPYMYIFIHSQKPTCLPHNKMSTRDNLRPDKMINIQTMFSIIIRYFKKSK